MGQGCQIDGLGTKPCSRKVARVFILSDNLHRTHQLFTPLYSTPLHDLNLLLFVKSFVKQGECVALSDNPQEVGGFKNVVTKV